jgi:hypothetical protein
MGCGLDDRGIVVGFLEMRREYQKYFLWVTAAISTHTIDIPQK